MRLILFACVVVYIIFLLQAIGVATDIRETTEVCSGHAACSCGNIQGVCVDGHCQCDYHNAIRQHDGSICQENTDCGGSCNGQCVNNHCHCDHSHCLNIGQNCNIHNCHCSHDGTCHCPHNPPTEREVKKQAPSTCNNDTDCSTDPCNGTCFHGHCHCDHSHCNHSCQGDNCHCSHDGTCHCH